MEDFYTVLSPYIVIEIVVHLASRANTNAYLLSPYISLYFAPFFLKKKNECYI